MRFSAGKLLSLLLLSIYGSISLLGYGLHELSHAHKHHHVSPTAEHHSAGHHHHDHSGCSGHHHHHHPAPPAPDGEGVDHSHDCEICEFLAQIRSQAPQLTVLISSDRLVVEAIIVTPILTAHLAQGLHAPRGPPTCSA